MKLGVVLRSLGMIATGLKKEQTFVTGIIGGVEYRWPVENVNRSEKMGAAAFRFNAEKAEAWTGEKWVPRRIPA